MIYFSSLPLFFCSYKIVATQSAIYQVNKDIQLLDAEISEQMQATEDLQSEINSLLEYERVLGTAKKQGLETNKDRVKVVAE